MDSFTGLKDDGSTSVRAAGFIPAVLRTASIRPPAASRREEQGLGGGRLGLGVAHEPGGFSITAPRPMRKAVPGLTGRNTSWWGRSPPQMDGFRCSRLSIIADRAPSYRPPENAQGLATIGGTDAFMMNADGKSWIFAPQGLQDGPLPAHYEPQESLIQNPLYGQQCNPARMEWKRRENPYHRAWGDPAYPYLLTTYRLTEHHTAGAGCLAGCSGWRQLQPEMFSVRCRLQLRRRKGTIQWRVGYHFHRAGGYRSLRVLVTERLKPLRIRGRWIHQNRLAVPLGQQGVGARRFGKRPDLICRRSERIDSGVQSLHREHRTGPARTRARDFRRNCGERGSKVARLFTSGAP